MECFDFITVDFETATQHYNSACAIGVAAVKNGKIAGTFYSLLKPPNLRFSPQNIAIHGITPEMVKESPTFSEVWGEIGYIFESNLVIAHNAYFDMSVLLNSLESWMRPDFKYVDSVAIAKDVVPGSKSLKNCAEYLGIEMGEHHNAIDDAVTCAKIVLVCLERSYLPNIGSLCFAKKNVKIHQLSDLSSSETYHVHTQVNPIGAQRKSHFSSSYVRAKEIVAASPSDKESLPLYQKLIVFTGTPSIGRRQAMQLAADAGAILKDSISQKVNYLVVGQKDSEFTDEDGLSRKERKALELNEKGKSKIKILNETEFLALLEGKSTVSTHTE